MRAPDEFVEPVVRQSVDASVGATAASCALPENGCRIASGRAMGGIRLPPDGVCHAGCFLTHLGR